MPEPCPEFLPSWVPRLAGSIPRSCDGRPAPLPRALTVSAPALWIPWDSGTVMASLSMAVILLSLRQDSHKDVPCWVGESTTSEMLPKCASVAAVKAKPLGLLLGCPKTTVSTPFLTDRNIQEPF